MYREPLALFPQGSASLEGQAYATLTMTSVPSDGGVITCNPRAMATLALTL